MLSPLLENKSNDSLVSVDLVARYVQGPWTLALNVDNFADETSYSSDALVITRALVVQSGFR